MPLPENSKSVFISYGEQVKMYTLHVIYDMEQIDDKGHKFTNSRSTYVKNLSTNRETAVDKAVEYASARGIEFVYTKNALKELNEIVRIEREEALQLKKDAEEKRIQEITDHSDEMVIIFEENFQSEKFSFGKYSGTKFSDVMQNDHQYIRYIISGNEDTLPIEFPRTVNEVCLNALFKYVQEVGFPPIPEDDSEYVGERGERVEVTVKVTKKVAFDTRFGIKVMYTFIDESNNVYVTFYSGNTWSVDTDEHVKIKGTVDKHEVYNNIKQTHLKRVKVV